MKEFLKVIVAFFAVFGEMFRQFYLSFKMSSEDFQALQDEKFREEASKPILNAEGEEI